MKVDVISKEGKSTGRSVELPDDIFGIEPNEHVVYLAVKSYNAAQRQGTHKSKERGEVKGSRRKIKKQKGTGTARAGDIKNPLFRGGGRVFGPRPHLYNVKLNKKVRSLGKASALAYKAQNDNIKVMEDLSFGNPKTKEFVSVLEGLNLSDKKTLFVTGDHDKNVYLSARNIQGANVVNVKDMNIYEIMKANIVVFSESSVGKIKESFAK